MIRRAFLRHFTCMSTKLRLLLVGCAQSGLFVLLGQLLALNQLLKILSRPWLVAHCHRGWTKGRHSGRITYLSIRFNRNELVAIFKRILCHVQPASQHDRALTIFPKSFTNFIWPQKNASRVGITHQLPVRTICGTGRSSVVKAFTIVVAISRRRPHSLLCLGT